MRFIFTKKGQKNPLKLVSRRNTYTPITDSLIVNLNEKNAAFPFPKFSTAHINHEKSIFNAKKMNTLKKSVV